MSDLAMMVPYKNPGYGAIEIKLIAHVAMAKAMFLSTTLMFMMVCSYYVGGHFFRDDHFPLVHPPRPQWDHDYIPWRDFPKSSSPVVPKTNSNIGIPVPVPDAEVNPDQTIATQTDISQTAALNTNSEGVGNGEGVIIDDGPPLDFVPYEKEPVIVRSVKPVYPPIALRAGVEGDVVVKIWVDKEGKARQAVVMRSDAAIFDQVAIDAAMQHVFTPALMQNKPVSVWVAIPFKFRLSNSR